METILLSSITQYGLSKYSPKNKQQRRIKSNMDMQKHKTKKDQINFKQHIKQHNELKHDTG